MFMRHPRRAPLKGEGPYEDEMWELFPSRLSDKILEAILTGMRMVGTLEPATAAFIGLSKPSGV
jgi:hypothetical protein